jgi:hypothetical protein
MSDNSEKLSDDVMDVWEGYDDFKTGGLEYVYWVQQQNLEEMIEASSDEGAVNELADQAIVAIRQLHEMGYDPEKFIRNRLHERMDGEQENIINTYQSDYNDE